MIGSLRPATLGMSVLMFVTLLAGCPKKSSSPCATNNGGCDIHATCTANAQDQSICECETGYTGSGLVCSTELPSDAGAPDGSVEPDGGQDAGPTCSTNFHICGGVCVFNGDPQTCGETCSPCPTVQNGAVTCDGTSCGFTCGVDAGYHACGSSCVFEDGNSCGPSCMQCPAAMNATPLCDSTPDGGVTCGSSCNGDYIVCDNGNCGSNLGRDCLGDADCCYGACDTNGLCCAAPGTNTPCQAPTDCQNNACSNLTSGQLNFFQCSAGVCCLGGGGSCSSGADCCSGNCNSLGSDCE